MRSRIITLPILSLLATAPLTACDYEWKDEPPPSAFEEEVPAEPEVAPEEDGGEKPAAQPSAERPTIAPGKIVASTENVPKGLKKVNILDLEAAGKVTVDSPASGQDAPKLFDGNDETLVRTDSINPLKITLTFTDPIKLKAVRVLSTYSDYSWSLTPEGGERIVLDSIPEGVSSVLVLPAQVTTKKISFEVLRKSRDNYVHVNEVELFE